MDANLTEADLHLIDRAREVGPALRASTSDRDRLAGWLLKELADLAERLAAAPAPRPHTPSSMADEFQRRAEAREARLQSTLDAMSDRTERTPEEVAELKARLARLEGKEPQQ